MEAFVRTNLLPYDFALTAEQTAEVLAGVVARMEISGNEELFSSERCQRMGEIAGEIIDRYRDEYIRAEDVRRKAVSFVAEFLSVEATLEELEKLQERFRLPYPSGLHEELERQVRVWLSSLPHARLAACGKSTLRDLVVSEIRSWC